MAAWHLPRVSFPIAALVIAGGIATGVTGCSTTTKLEVSKTSLADTIKSKLTEQADAPPIEQVKCKDSLDGKVGATQVCAVKSDGKWYNVNVNATSVDGKQVNFNYKLDPDPISAPSY